MRDERRGDKWARPGRLSQPVCRPRKSSGSPHPPAPAGGSLCSREEDRMCFDVSASLPNWRPRASKEPSPRPAAAARTHGPRERLPTKAVPRGAAAVGRGSTRPFAPPAVLPLALPDAPSPHGLIWRQKGRRVHRAGDSGARMGSLLPWASAHASILARARGRPALGWGWCPPAGPPPWAPQSKTAPDPAQARPVPPPCFLQSCSEKKKSQAWAPSLPVPRMGTAA